MPRIHTITTDTVLSDNDMLLGTDGANGANNATKNFSFGVFKNYITSNVTFTGDTFISGGNLTLDNNYYLKGKLTNGTAIDLIGVKNNNLVTISDDAQETHIGPIGGNTNFQVNGALVLTGAAVLNGAMTVAGNTTLGNALTDTVTVAGDATFNRDVTITRNLTVNGTINLGDADTDSVVFGADVDSHILPDDDKTFDLGSSSKQWRELYAKGASFEADINVGGISNLKAVNVGVNGDGHVVKFFGDTSGRKIDFDPTGNASLNFTDTTMAKFGDSGDLQIYHNGTANYIDSNGGQMFLRASVSDGKMFFMGDDGNGGYAEYFYLDGAAAVYDSNQGQAVSVETRFPPDSKATFGITGSMQTSLWNSNAGDFFMSETGGGNMNFHTDGTHILFGKRGAGATHQAPLTGAETMAKFIADGAVELYHDNAKKLETTATGITVTGSIAGALNTIGGTLHDPTFTGTVTSNANLIVLAGQDTAAQIELKADAGDNNDDHWKLSAEPNATFKILTRDGGTYSSAVDFVSSNKNAYFKGDISVLDNKKLLVGSGEDLQIFHDGSDSYVSDTGDGNLYLKGGNQVRIVGDTANSDEIWAVFGQDAAELWFNGNKKLETTSFGVQTTGSLNIHGAYQFPITDGTNGQVLKTNGNGTLSFADDIGALLGIQEGGEFTNSLIVGHATTGTLTSALGNTGVGVGVINAITTGDHNAALGHDALGALTTGGSNVAIGKQALFSSVVDSNNVAIGKDALYSLTNSNVASPVSGEAQNNVAIGWQAGNGITTGTNNIVIGYNADASSATANNEITIGNTSHTLLRIPGLGTTNDNVLKYSSAAGGWVAGTSPSASGVPFKLGGNGFGGTTNPSLLIGHDVTGDLSSNTSSDGFANVGVGHGALEDITEGVHNSVVGFDAGAKLTVGDSNTFMGAYAGNQIVEMKYNVLIGGEAGRFIDTGDATNPSTNVNSHNVGIGYHALKGSSSQRITGTNNVAIGSGAMDSPTTATGNVAIGKDAGENLYDGDFNVMIGYQSGDGGGGEGNQNTLVGANTDLTSSGASGNVLIGYSITTSNSNYTQIGNNNTQQAIIKGLKREVSSFEENGQAQRNHIHVLDATGDLTVTLPDSGSDSSLIGMSFTFVTKTAPSTGNVHKIKCNDTNNESIFGSILATKASSAGSDFMQTDDATIADGRSAINLNGTTQGGREGTHITLTCIAADTWLVEGTMRYSGTFASSFSNS